MKKLMRGNQRKRTLSEKYILTEAAAKVKIEDAIDDAITKLTTLPYSKLEDTTTVGTFLNKIKSDNIISKLKNDMTAQLSTIQGLSAGSDINKAKEEATKYILLIKKYLAGISLPKEVQELLDFSDLNKKAKSATDIPDIVKEAEDIFNVFNRAIFNSAEINDNQKEKEADTEKEKINKLISNKNAILSAKTAGVHSVTADYDKINIDTWDWDRNSIDYIKNKIDNAVNETSTLVNSIENVKKDAKDSHELDSVKSNFDENNNDRDWEELLKNIDKPDADGKFLFRDREDFWNTYYKEVWGKEDAANADKVKELGSAFETECEHLGFTANTNPFIYFIKKAISTGLINVIKSGTYGAIHNAYVRGYIHIEDLKNENGLIYNPKLYAMQGIDILDYLEEYHRIVVLYKNGGDAPFKISVLNKQFGNNKLTEFLKAILNQDINIFDKEAWKHATSTLSTIAKLAPLATVEASATRAFGKSKEEKLRATNDAMRALLKTKEEAVKALKYIAISREDAALGLVKDLADKYGITDTSFDIKDVPVFAKKFENIELRDPKSVMQTIATTFDIKK